MYETREKSDLRFCVIAVVLWLKTHRCLHVRRLTQTQKQYLVSTVGTLVCLCWLIIDLSLLSPVWLIVLMGASAFSLFVFLVVDHSEKTFSRWVQIQNPKANPTDWLKCMLCTVAWCLQQCGQCGQLTTWKSTMMIVVFSVFYVTSLTVIVW